MISLERRFITEAQGGNTEAFSALVDMHRERALRQAYFFTANWEEAKDVSQRAFIKAFRSIRKFRGESEFYTWFYRILSNVAKDHLRSRWWRWNLLRQRHRQQEEPTDMLEQVASNSPGPAQALMHREWMSSVQAALGLLPAGVKEVVILRYNNDLSLQEIAERLGKAVGTVKSQLFAAHRKIHDYLIGQGKGGMTRE